MKPSLILITFLIFLCSCDLSQTKADDTLKVIEPTFTTYPIQSSIRAIEVIDQSTMWYAGSEGKWGYTTDEGNSWHHDSILVEGVEMDFRAIAITNDAVFLLNVGSPALLYKSVDKGKNWEIVYREEHPDAFYNSMAFWDNNEGIAVGDPIDGCLSVIITRDGGENWEKLSCDDLPPIVDGEMGFAASNTNIALYKNHVWLATGSKRARVFQSSDKGKTWEVYDTPILQGDKMTGIFSIDFKDENLGIIFGGDWNKQSYNKKAKAITNDGGKTWQLVSDGKGPGQKACVQFFPDNSKQIFAVGMTGISYSGDSGASWNQINGDSYYTIRLIGSGDFAWLAGKNVLAKMKWEK